jgi:hypothetical protein
MMWPEPELRAIIRPEPEMKNRSLHSTSPGTHGTGRTRKLSVVSKGDTLELGRFSTRNNFHRRSICVDIFCICFHKSARPKNFMYTRGDIHLGEAS